MNDFKQITIKTKSKTSMYMKQNLSYNVMDHWSTVQLNI